jgi:hypothetical protein
VDRKRLDAFARFVLKNEASIVTFNYDDVFDQALWEVSRRVALKPFALNSLEPEPYWHPDGGYGFYCRQSTVCVADDLGFMDQPRSFLLKLHGSIKWRSRLGEGTPRGPGAFLHHEDWLPHRAGQVEYGSSAVEPHLEPEPFIVPPVLVKVELSLHPVLRVVWEHAYHRLANAKTVVFVGYSLPETDLASRTLFRESVANRVADVRIVNKAGNSDQNQRLKATYRSLFQDLSDAQFDFSGALGGHLKSRQ